MSCFQHYEIISCFAEKAQVQLGRVLSVFTSHYVMTATMQLALKLKPLKENSDVINFIYSWAFSAKYPLK